MQLFTKSHLKYFLGHTEKSNQALSTYQSLTRRVDITATRFGTESSTENLDWIASVAYNGANEITFRKTLENQVLERMRESTAFQCLLTAHCDASDAATKDFPDIQAGILDVSLSFLSCHI